MGSFLSKVAAIDPIAQSLDLPGSKSYANSVQQQNQADAEANGLGPYARVAPSLAGAQAGYVQGGPGATPGWQPYVPKGGQGGLFGAAESLANFAGNLPGVKVGSGSVSTGVPNFNNNQPPTQGQAYGYVQAAKNAATGSQAVQQQSQLTPFGAIQRAATQGTGANIGGY
jgi:hypothetical protein